MNRIRQNITHFALCLFGLLFFAAPQITFAADEGASFAQNIVWGILVTITGTFLRIAGIVFDYGINTFVIGFGELYTTSGVGFAVDNAWVTIRDFVNLFFIFGLVYIGIKLILDSNDSNTRRWLVNLVIAALLINFSLFITKFVVDFSNQLSYQIAQGAGWYNDANGVAQSEVKMANRILDYMGITEIFNLSGDTLNNASWGYIFGTAIFFTITAFILIAGGFLLIIRFAMLNLFLVMSPLMFISWVLPPLKDYMSEYWRNFLGRAFFAPVYFMFMYFSLEILKGFQTYIKGGLGNAGSNMAQTLAGENGRQVLTSTQSTMPFFFLICIFMVASLVIASKMGADFGDKAVGLGRSLSNKAGNYAKRGAGRATFGSAALAGQATVGLGANRLASSRRFQNLAAKNKFARAALQGTRTVADSSFDARRVGGLGKSLGIGEGIKGGYDTRSKNKQKRDEEFFKSLDDADMDDPANKAKAAALAQQKASEAASKKQTGEKDKKVVAALQEHGQKDTADLTSEIDSLNGEIANLANALQARIDDASITTQEEEEARKEIEEKTKTVTSMTYARDEKLEQEVLADKIQQAGYDASLQTDPSLKAIYREKQQQMQKELASRTDLSNRLKQAEESIVEADKKIASAKEEAANEIKFENKIAYLDAKKKTFSPAGGGFKFNPLEEESYENLVKKFGADAAGMSKKSKESKQKKKLAEAIEEAQKEAEKKEKKEDEE
jgi:hypothetical protein